MKVIQFGDKWTDDSKQSPPVTSVHRLRAEATLSGPSAVHLSIQMH